MFPSESRESGRSEDEGLGGDGPEEARKVVDVEDCVGEERGDDAGCEEGGKREERVRRVEERR